MSTTDPNQMNFFEHLEELRGRIFKSLGLWVLVFILCFIWVKPLFEFLAQPLIDMTSTDYVFAAYDIKEPFLANLKAAFWVSLILSSGIFFYHIWGFIGPGLSKAEKLFAVPFLIFMSIFFVAGCFFSFKIVYPYALEYLIHWNSGNLNAYTRSSYLSLLFAFVIGMGASFEMPLIIFLLAKVGLVTPRFLVEKFKYAIVLIFTVAAIITPTPDIYMQTFLALPMIALYLLGVGAAWVVTRGKGVDSEHEALEAGEDTAET